MSSRDDLARLGRAVAEGQDALRAGARHKREARRALFDRPALPRARFGNVALAALAAVVVLAGLLLFEPWRGGSWVTPGSHHAATDRAEVLRFEDGTTVTLEPGARARVDRIDGQGADVTLEAGSLYARVTKREGAAWAFRAGDYLVKVTGTAFDLSVRPPQVELVMHEGSVVVTGPGLREPQRVVAGERRVFPPGDEVVPDAEETDPASHGDAQGETGDVVDAGEAGDAPTTAPATSAQAVETWQARAARGDHAGAFEQVAPSLDRELASLDAASLVRLATVARLSGHPDVARRVHLVIRERFPGTPSAADAAFSLGTVAFSRDTNEASKWFQIALAEAPSGGLAASARGRLLELAIRRGDAKAAAEDYLRHHPDGPHAALARDALAP
ncbi:MAG: FecR family protein [Polyangiaceae bacterium]